MEQVGKYQILRQIGEGGIGVLYHGRDIETSQEVTVKVLRAEHARDPGMVVRFLRGAEAAGSLVHPAIVTIHGFGDEKGVPYVVMEYGAFRSLKEIIDVRRPMPMAERLEVIAQVAEGLQYAHSLGIFHRNVKPSHIYVEEDGSARIGGFDIAKISGPEGGRSDGFRGTPAYMAPEQIRGDNIDGRADLFSLGVTLYHLIAFRKPWTADPSRVHLQILGEPPAPLVEVYGTPHAWAEAVVMRCLQKDPARRLASCQDLADELRKRH